MQFPALVCNLTVSLPKPARFRARVPEKPEGEIPRREQAPGGRQNINPLQWERVAPGTTKMEDKIMAIVRSQNWLPSIFNDFFNDEWLAPRTRQGVPAVNIMENEKDYKIELAAPGMGKEDLHVSINDDNELVIAFEKKTENGNEDKENRKKGTYLRREFSYNSFRQSFTLPDDVDRENIAASMEHGVLTVELPKKDMSKEVPASRQIEIR